MNRTLILLLAVLLLGGIAWWATSSAQKPASAEERAEIRRFGYQNFDEVHKIFVADRKGHNVTLVRGGISGWLADGKPANDNIMKNLSDAVQNMDIRSLPTEKAKPNMVKDLATNGILVQLFDKEGKKLRGYYLGSGTYDELGTNAIVEGSEEPYVVHLPHFTGNIRQRFTHWDDEWRDKVYFRVDPENIELFSIEYPRQRNKSFKITRDGDKYVAAPFYETGQPVREVSRAAVESALVRYEKYYINRYQNNDKEGIEAVKGILPFATITVKQAGSEAQEMRVFPKYTNHTFTQDPKTGAVTEQNGLESYNAYINNGEDWVLLNVETAQQLFIGFDSFQ
ncbi:hypothetical protein FUA23_14735 [Neolewinella aurantiaca]|uniref:Rhodanese domain-containing protein n=1 Tax=Neolewinella aurantiaca TaxID=2602767 RepID=A0A5C7FQS4_9BACT|nr:hypothetical protein [Neolewinella aurantiaca]TXF88391.1 hypothetical protein FUA23_14735 [Neolewinella aurantiaca]